MRTARSTSTGYMLMLVTKPDASVAANALPWRNAGTVRKEAEEIAAVGKAAVAAFCSGVTARAEQSAVEEAIFCA